MKYAAPVNSSTQTHIHRLIA